MLTSHVALAIFLMLGLSSLAVFWAKRIRLPHTVVLVLIGVGLGLLATIPTFTFFEEFQLTPSLLFYIFLPTLLFESAYNINARRMVEDTVPIVLLAVLSLVVSAVSIGGALFYILPLFGIQVPFVVALLFGSLISATDPVAVLALFKEFGAPRRLSLIFEGESLFNDATSVALFLVVLGIVIHGYTGLDTIALGVTSFLSMIFGGIIFGVIMGGLFAKLVGATRESEIASITLTIVLAHTTFILSELVSEALSIGTIEFPLSPIIATTIASLVMGNYGRPKIHPKAEAFVEKLWSQLAFMANSLVFILIGVLFVQVPLFNGGIFLVIVSTVLVVAIARAVSVYPIIGMYNRFVSLEQTLPVAWQHLLSWGSLRGALAVIMVLLIPDDLTVPGWTIDMSVKEFILALTVGCIFATLFIKATTISNLMKKLKLDVLTPVEEVEYQEAKALIHHEVADRLFRYTERGYIEATAAAHLSATHDTHYQNACEIISTLSADAKKQLAYRVLRIFTIGIERRHLKELYHHNEVNEAVFRRLQGKLQLQLEAIEYGNLAPNVSLHTDGKDVFEHIASFVRDLIAPLTPIQKIENLYMYYRAQVIISRKVLKEINAIDHVHAKDIFTEEALNHTLELYTTFKTQSENKMNELQREQPTIIAPLTVLLAEYGVIKIEETLLTELYERELVTPKLYIALQEELL